MLTLFLAAALAVPAATQTPPYTAPLQGCTTSSFEIPSWFVQNVQYTRNSSTLNTGALSFHLTSRATNTSAEVTCQVAESNSWNLCSVSQKKLGNETFQAKVATQNNAAFFNINQTWTCHDRSGAPPLAFRADGNGSVAVDCADVGKPCKVADSPILVRGVLRSPVAITPEYADGPTGHEKGGCSAAAQNPTWNLTTIYYEDQRGDDVSAAAFQNLILQVINPAIGYQAGCMTTTTPNPTPGIMALQCSGVEFQSQGRDRYHLTTTAWFEPSSLTFVMNQTWYCDDIDEAKPVSITATASKALPLNCTTMPIERGSSMNKTICSTDDEVTMQGKLVSQQALAPYSLTDPLPVADGCTVSSIVHPQWSLSAFEVDRNTTAGAANLTSVAFNIMLQTQNPGFQFPIRVLQGKPAANSSWYECDILGREEKNQLLWPNSCSLRYDATKKELELKADWICNELDPYRPILFSGTTTTTIVAPLTCDVVNGVEECVTSDGRYTWVANIDNVKWGAAQ